MRTGTAGVALCLSDREIFEVDINDPQNFEHAVESGRNRSGCRHKLAVFRSKGPIITRCPLTQDGEGPLSGRFLSQLLAVAIEAR